MPPIDLIALDLDGTLLDSQDGVSEANRSAIRASLAAGVRVVLVTGRGADAPARLVRELNLNLPCICAHGALTKDFLSGRTLGHIPVPSQLARPLLEYAEQNELNVAVYHEERFHRLSGTPLYMDDQLGPHWCEVPTFAGLMPAAPTFIRYLGRDAVEALREAFPSYPLHFKFEQFLDWEECAITSPEATKKIALERLCRDFNIASENVMALGDSRNDVPMMRWAGVGVAMGNALPDVREAVGRVTAPYDRDGVALAIEKYVLEPRREKSA